MGLGRGGLDSGDLKTPLGVFVPSVDGNTRNCSQSDHQRRWIGGDNRLEVEANMSILTCQSKGFYEGASGYPNEVSLKLTSFPVDRVME